MIYKLSNDQVCVVRDLRDAQECLDVNMKLSRIHELEVAFNRALYNYNDTCKLTSRAGKIAMDNMLNA